MPAFVQCLTCKNINLNDGTCLEASVVSAQEYNKLNCRYYLPSGPEVKDLVENLMRHSLSKK